jgi:hypothetical protein
MPLPLTGFYIFAFGMLLSVLVGLAGVINMAFGMSAKGDRADGMFKRHLFLMIPAASAGVITTVGTLWLAYDFLVWASQTH